MKAILATAILIVALYLFRMLRRREYIDRLIFLMGRIRMGHHTRVAEALQDYTLADDPDLWHEMRGLRGLYECLDESRTRCLIAQVCYDNHTITGSDAWEVWSKAICQFYYTIRAFPEALLCWVLPILPHQCAHTALMFHHDLILRLETVCSGADGPEVLRRLPDLR